MRATLDFLLHDWLRVESLLDRPRFAEHSRETVAQVLDTCERIARDKFVPKIGAWLSVVAARDPSCLDMQATWF